MMMQVKCRFIHIGVDMVMRKWLQRTAMMGRGVVETAMQIKPDHDCLQETLPFYTALHKPWTGGTMSRTHFSFKYSIKKFEPSEFECKLNMLCFQWFFHS